MLCSVTDDTNWSMVEFSVLKLMFLQDWGRVYQSVSI